MVDVDVCDLMYAKDLRDFANLIQTLTSEAKVLNPDAYAVQGRSLDVACGGRSPPSFFLAKWINSFTEFFSKFQKMSE